MRYIWLTTAYNHYDAQLHGESRHGIFFSIQDNSSAGEPKGIVQPTNYYSGEIWDKWFSEKLEYNPLSGLASYYINGVSVLNSYVGSMNSTPETLRIYANSGGWFTGDYRFIDNVSVFQASVSGSAKPIPAAIWLVVSALVGLVGFGRRKVPV